MANDKQVRVVRTALRETLRPLGFTVAGGTSNRSARDGIIHVISLQFGTGSLTGSCTVNVGVFIPEVAAVFGVGPNRDHVSETACDVRGRIGRLMPSGDDSWWPFAAKPEEVARQVPEAVSQFALPFLSKLETREALVASWQALEAFTTPRRTIDLALVLAAAGRRAEALELIERALQSSSPHIPLLAKRAKARIERHAPAV